MSRSAGILFLAALCSLSVLSAAEPCPAGWTFNSANNHCYNLEATASPVTWVQARAACAAYNARTTLVTPGSQAENDYVYNYVKTEKAYNGNIWIGLEGNDAYTVSGNETCSAALITPSMGRKYNGSIGTGTGTVDPYGYCDMPGKENFFRFTAGVGGTWTFKVYSTFDAVIDLYSGACTSYIDCEDYYGANATDTMTYTLTAGQTYTVVVDKYRTTDSGTYTLEIMAPTDNGKRAYSWIDDTDTTYTNWDSGEPNNSGGAEACAELKIGTTTYGKWNDVPCDSSGALHAYVCEYVSSICGDTVVEGIEECDDGNLTDGDGCDSNCRPTGCGNGLVTAGEQCDDGNVIDLDGCKNDCTLPCPDGWGYSTATGNCYNLYGVGDTKTWIEADAACETAYGNGTTLATIGDATENAFIFNYVKNTKAYNGNIWLGMEGETAYPSFGNETCSTAWMAPSMGRKYTGSIGTGTGTVDPYGWCDMPGKENFFRFTAGVSGYWRFSVYSTFDAVIDLYSGACTSYIDCEDYYGANATDWMEYPLTAGQVYTVVVDKYSTSDSGTYTLDIMPPTDRGKKAFSWINDTDTTYTNWDTNEPSGGTEGCVEMKIATTTNAKWNDLACNSSSVKLAYTCETTGNILALQNKEAITELDLSNRGLTSLEGIQAFANLQVLNIAGNPVTALEPLWELVDLQEITGTPQGSTETVTIVRGLGEPIYDFVEKIKRGFGILPIFPFNYVDLESLKVYYNFEQPFRYGCLVQEATGACSIYSGEIPNVALGHQDEYDGVVYMAEESAFRIVSAEEYSEQWFFGKKGAFFSSAVMGVGYVWSPYVTPSYGSSFTVSVRSSVDATYEEPMELIRIGNWESNDLVIGRGTHLFYVNDELFYPAGERLTFIDADLLTLVCNGSTCDIYVNGVRKQFFHAIPQPYGNIAIGADFIGRVDEFRIHEEALSQEQIRDLYFFHVCPLNSFHDMTNHGVCGGLCGDGLVAVGDEECDDGQNGDNCDGCLDNCTAHTNTCGDGYICDAEICDDGTKNGEYSRCKTDCSGKGPYCGDSLVQTESGEECDDGNTITEACVYGETSCTVCNLFCREEEGNTAYCGDLIVNGPEECDGAPVDCRTLESGHWASGTAECGTACQTIDTSLCRDYCFEQICGVFYQTSGDLGPIYQNEHEGAFSCETSEEPPYYECVCGEGYHLEDRGNDHADYAICYPNVHQERCRNTKPDDAEWSVGVNGQTEDGRITLTWDEETGTYSGNPYACAWQCQIGFTAEKDENGPLFDIGDFINVMGYDPEGEPQIDISRLEQLVPLLRGGTTYFTPWNDGYDDLRTSIRLTRFSSGGRKLLEDYPSSGATPEETEALAFMLVKEFDFIIGMVDAPLFSSSQLPDSRLRLKTAQRRTAIVAGQSFTLDERMELNRWLLEDLFTNNAQPDYADTEAISPREVVIKRGAWYNESVCMKTKAAPCIQRPVGLDLVDRGEEETPRYVPELIYYYYSQQDTRDRLAGWDHVHNMWIIPFCEWECAPYTEPTEVSGTAWTQCEPSEGITFHDPLFKSCVNRHLVNWASQWEGQWAKTIQRCADDAAFASLYPQFCGLISNNPEYFATYFSELMSRFLNENAFVTPADVEKIKILDCSYGGDHDNYDPSLLGTKILDVSGLEYFAKLEELYLKGNSIIDLSPLSALSENRFSAKPSSILLDPVTGDSLNRFVAEVWRFAKIYGGSGTIVSGIEEAHLWNWESTGKLVEDTLKGAPITLADLRSDIAADIAACLDGTDSALVLAVKNSVAEGSVSEHLDLTAGDISFDLLCGSGNKIPFWRYRAIDTTAGRKVEFELGLGDTNRFFRKDKELQKIVVCDPSGTGKMQEKWETWPDENLHGMCLTGTDPNSATCEKYREQLEKAGKRCGPGKQAKVLSIVDGWKMENNEMPVSGNDFPKAPIMVGDTTDPEEPEPPYEMFFCPDVATNTAPAQVTSVASVFDTRYAELPKIVCREITVGYKDTARVSAFDISDNTHRVGSFCRSIFDMNPLRDLSQLKYLHMAGNTPLKITDCDYEYPRDLEPIGGLRNIEWLDITGNLIVNEPKDDYPPCDVIDCSKEKMYDYRIARHGGTRPLGNLTKLRYLGMANTGMEYLNPQLSTEQVPCECGPVQNYRLALKGECHNYDTNHNLIGNIYFKTEIDPNYRGRSLQKGEKIYFTLNTNIPREALPHYGTPHMMMSVTLSTGVFLNKEIDYAGPGETLNETWEVELPRELKEFELKGVWTIIISFEFKHEDLIYAYKCNDTKEYPQKTKLPVPRATEFTIKFGEENTKCENNYSPYYEDTEKKYEELCQCDIYTGGCKGKRPGMPFLFDRLTNLQYLDISNNPLKEYETQQIISTFANEPASDHEQLIDLKVGRFSGLDKLEHLRGLRAGNIYEDEGVCSSQNYPYNCLKDALESRTGLEILDIGHNKLDDISFLYPMKDIRELILAGNDLSDLWVLFKGWVSDLAPIEDKGELNYLDISHNNLHALEPIKYLWNLEYFDISGNAWTNLDQIDRPPLDPFERVTTLKMNDIGSNNAYWIAAMPYLKELEASGNLIEYAQPLLALPYLRVVTLHDHCLQEVDLNALIAKVTGDIDEDPSSACPTTPSAFVAYCGNNIVESGEFCDGNRILCADIAGENYVYGYATCNRDCYDWDYTNCYTAQDLAAIDEVGDQDVTLEQPDTGCPHGTIHLNSYGDEFCLCDYGYYKMNGVCVPERRDTESPKSGEELARETHAPVSIGFIEVPDDADTAQPDDNYNPGTVSELFKCPIPTVENCMSAIYRNDPCGKLHADTCRDMLRICEVVGKNCCISESSDPDTLRCDQRYDEYCARGTGDNADRCSRTATRPGDQRTFFGCRFDGDTCCAPRYDCVADIERTDDPCATATDCVGDYAVCEGGRCVYANCTVENCDEEMCAAYPDEGDPNRGRICIPKEMYDRLKDLEEQGDEQTRHPDRVEEEFDPASGEFVTTTLLPEPTFRDVPCSNSYLVWAQQRQAGIHNLVRPVDYKMPKNSDPARDRTTGYVACRKYGLCSAEDGAEGAIRETGNNRNASLSQEYPSSRRSGEEDASGAEILGGADKVYDVGCNLRGPCPSWWLGAPDPNATTPQALDKHAILNALDFILWGDTAGWRPNKKIGSCEQFVYQKYYDYNRFIDIASVFEREPLEILRMTFPQAVSIENTDEFLPLAFDALAQGEHNWVDVGKRLGDYASVLSHPMIKQGSGIHRSRNLFWEVVHHARKQAFVPNETIIPHMKNGLYMQAAPEEYSVGLSAVQFYRPDVLGAIPSGVCPAGEPQEGMSPWATDGECPLGTTESLSTYRFFTNRTVVFSLDFQDRVRYVSLLRQSLTLLLLQRANIEVLWTEKKEEARRANPVEIEYYRIADITTGTRDLLDKLSLYSDVSWIATTADIPYKEIVTRLETDNDYGEAEALYDARLRAYRELKQKLDVDIRASRFYGTDNARRLWDDHHYGNTAYLTAPTGLTKERTKLYPGSDTEYLIEDTLREIDERIEKVLGKISGLASEELFPENNDEPAIDCFADQDNTDSQNYWACNYDPADFVKRTRTLIPPQALERDFKKCETMTGNDKVKAFGPNGKLRKHHLLRVFRPNLSETGYTELPAIDPYPNDGDPNEKDYTNTAWSAVLAAMNVDPLREQDASRVDKVMKVLEAVAKQSSEPEYRRGFFRFGRNDWDIQQEDTQYGPHYVKVRTDPQGNEYQGEYGETDFPVKNLFEACYQDMYLCSTGSCSEDTVDSTEFFSVLDIETSGVLPWQCLEAYFDAYPQYVREKLAVERRIKVVAESYELKKAALAARKLRDVGMFDPEGAGAGQFGDGEEGEEGDATPQNPLGIPTSMEKWFSNYRQFGPDDLNANFSYIAGFGVRDFIIDWRRFNPIPKLRDMDAFLPHLAKALYKHKYAPGAEEWAQKVSDGTAETDARKIAFWMRHNLKNIEKLEYVLGQTLDQVDDFSLGSISKALNPKKPLGLSPEVIGKALAREMLNEILLMLAESTGKSPADLEKLSRDLQRGAALGERSVMESYDQYEAKQEDIEKFRANAKDILDTFEKDMEYNYKIVLDMVSSKEKTVEILVNTITKTLIDGDPLNPIKEMIGKVLGSYIESLVVSGVVEPGIVTIPDSCGTGDFMAAYKSNSACRNDYRGNLNAGAQGVLTDGDKLKKLFTYDSVLRGAVHGFTLDTIAATFGLEPAALATITSLLSAMEQNVCQTKVEHLLEETVFDANTFSSQNSCYLLADAPTTYDDYAQLTLPKAARMLIELRKDSSGNPPERSLVVSFISAYLDASAALKKQIGGSGAVSSYADFLADLFLLEYQVEGLVKDLIEVASLPGISEVYNKDGGFTDCIDGASTIRFPVYTDSSLRAVIEDQVKASLKSGADSALEILMTALIDGKSAYDVMEKLQGVLTAFDPTKKNNVPTLEFPSFGEMLQVLANPELANCIIDFPPYVGTVTDVQNLGVKVGDVFDLGNSTSAIMKLKGSLAGVLLHDINSQNGVRFSSLNTTHFRRGLEQALNDVVMVGSTVASQLKALDVTTLIDVSQLYQLRIPQLPEESALADCLDPAIPSPCDGADFQEAFDNLSSSSLKPLDPFKEFAATIDVEKLGDRFDAAFFGRVLERALKDSMNYDLLREIFGLFKEPPADPNTSTDAYDNPLAFLTAPNEVGEGFDLVKISLDGSANYIGDFISFAKPEDSSALLDIVIEAFMSRMEEIIIYDLLKLPYAEVCAHARAGLDIFGEEWDLFEATYFITTRLQRDRYGHIVDLQNVHPKAREKFVKRYDKEIQPLKPYKKFFFVGSMISLADLEDVDWGELAEKALEAGVDAAQKRIDEELTPFNNLKDEKEFSKLSDDKGAPEDYKIGELEFGGDYSFQIGPIPCTLSWGVGLEAGVRVGYGLSAKLTQGFSAGASVGPYLIATAFLEVGIGFDYTFISLKIVIGGFVKVFDFYAPFKVQALLKPELDINGIAVNFYLRSSLIPVMELLSGYVYVKAKASIGKKPIALSFEVTQKIYEFDPLIKLTFPNLIPIEPLKFNLISIGEGVKLLNN